jgi:hypothetical protein
MSKTVLKPMRAKWLLGLFENTLRKLRTLEVSPRQWVNPGAIDVEGYGANDQGYRDEVRKDCRELVDIANQYQGKTPLPVTLEETRTLASLDAAIDFVEKLIGWAQSEMNPPPINDRKVFMAKVREAAPKAKILHDLIEMLVFDHPNKYVDFEDLREVVWAKNPDTNAGTITGRICAANKLLEKIGVKDLYLQESKEQAIAIFEKKPCFSRRNK